jgi:hypothetical protein
MEEGANVIYANPLRPSHFNRAVHSELDRITLKLLAKRPESRYQSAGKLIQDLRKVHDSLPEEEFCHGPGVCKESAEAITRISTILGKRVRGPIVFPTAFFSRACSRIGQAFSLLLM